MFVKLENSTQIYKTEFVNRFEEKNTQICNEEVLNAMEENSTQNYNSEVLNTYIRVYIILYGIGILIDITAICGNTLTMVTIAKFKQLRTKSNAIIFSLSVADFLVGITNLIENTLLVAGEQGLSKLFDQHVNIPVFVLSSMLHLLMVTMERYIFINYPLKYHFLITRRIICLLISIPWLVSFLTNIILIILSFMCIPKNLKLLRLIILCGYIIESIIIVTLYIKMLRIVQKQVRQIRNLSFWNRNGSISESERKVTITMGLIVGAFVISWMPERLYLLLITLDVITHNNIIYLVFGLIGYCNSVVNCFIYAWKNSQFRRAYYSLLCCQKMSPSH